MKIDIKIGSPFKGDKETIKTRRQKKDFIIPGFLKINFRYVELLKHFSFERMTLCKVWGVATERILILSFLTLSNTVLHYGGVLHK